MRTQIRLQKYLCYCHCNAISIPTPATGNLKDLRGFHQQLPLPIGYNQYHYLLPFGNRLLSTKDKKANKLVLSPFLKRIGAMALYLVYLVGYRKTINEILWVEKMNISLDANALTFLIEAIDPQYNPLYDKQLNYLQRISTIRIFLNDGSSCGILPQVVKEVGDICEYKTRVTAEPTDEISFHKVTLQCSDLDLQKRTEELLQIHPKKNHCILLAEAEFAGIDVLLTRDELFRNRLNPLSNVEIIFPSDYLALMNMQQDTKPEFRAPESNPLLGKSWLKTQCERLRNAIFR